MRRGRRSDEVFCQKEEKEAKWSKEVIPKPLVSLEGEEGASARWGGSRGSRGRRGQRVNETGKNSFG